MKKIDKQNADFSNAIGLFFVMDGLILKEHESFLQYKDIYRLLKEGLEIENVFLYDDLYIFKCQLINKEILDIFGFKIIDVKKICFSLFDDIKISKIITAYQWVIFDTQNRHCGYCGQLTYDIGDLREKKCINCQTSFFPKLSPAVIVVVKKKNQILLARSHYFEPKMYGAIAGFIDLGETAENAAIREVKEEVGIEIANLRYFGSQSWPFPNSFMMAFTAEHKSGDLIIDNKELEDARWFDIKNLPKLPNKLSIAYSLIDRAIKI